MGTLYVILCSYTFAPQLCHNLGMNITCYKNKNEMHLRPDPTTLTLTTSMPYVYFKCEEKKTMKVFFSNCNISNYTFFF